MARISQLSSNSSAAIEAGRRFQLPPGTEKRTQGSTLFSTTAKELVSSIPFRWRADQVKIFEDWVLYKGPNVMSADLLPLLRALDLDGYEDVKNYRGECVHDLIIVKVRRKLTRTKNTEMATEVDSTYDASRSKSTQLEDTSSVVSSPRSSAYGKISQPAYTQSTTSPIKHEQEDDSEFLNQTHVAPGGYRYKIKPNSDAAPTSVQTPRLSSYQESLLSRASEKENATTTPRSSPSSRYILRSRAFDNRNTRDKEQLQAGMDKLKAAMKELSFLVYQLPADKPTSILDTATHDTELEIDYLGELVKEYVRD